MAIIKEGIETRINPKETNEDLVKKILELKEEKNAIVLVHSYQRPEIYDVADYVGDSLGLSQQAADTDKDVIVFCGVHFMAETAKILSPEKKVLLPAYDAGCPMADMVTPEDIAEMKEKYPDAAVACYVNTTAAVKAASDICVTSANAAKVINSLEEEQVIFVPDKNLAAYVAENTNKQIIPIDGYCPIHMRFSTDDVEAVRRVHKDAYVLAHPECKPEVWEIADDVSSTTGIMNFAAQSEADAIIIGTEVGVIERLKLDYPEKKIYSLGAAKVCPNMKKTRLQHVYDALSKDQYQINVDYQIAQKARISLDRMLNAS